MTPATPSQDRPPAVAITTRVDLSCADVEEGLKELVGSEEAPRPVRWNQPLMVIISCSIILGILSTGIGFAIR